MKSILADLEFQKLRLLTFSDPPNLEIGEIQSQKVPFFHKIVKSRPENCQIGHFCDSEIAKIDFT